MFACHILNDQNLSDVFDQYYDDNDIPCIDSKYYDLDEFESLYVTKNLDRSEYSYIHMNIRSLPNKFDALDVLLSNLKSGHIEFDFILMCETFLTDANNAMYNFNGYKFVGKNRVHIKCGGVGIFVKNGISFKIREDLSRFIEHVFEYIFIEVTYIVAMVINI